jgi:hypothetical protein
VVPGRVLGVAVEEVSGDEGGLANPVEELVAALSGEGTDNSKRQNGGRQDRAEELPPASAAESLHGGSSYQTPVPVETVPAAVVN